MDVVVASAVISATVVSGGDSVVGEPVGGGVVAELVGGKVVVAATVVVGLAGCVDVGRPGDVVVVGRPGDVVLGGGTSAPASAIGATTPEPSASRRPVIQISVLRRMSLSRSKDPHQWSAWECDNRR